MTSYYRILRLNHGRAPTVQHATLKEAETEALRLAGQHPGDTFEILQVLGIARTTEPSVFWCDGAEPYDGGTPGIDPGEGYRALKYGELLEPGDQYREAGAWHTVDLPEGQYWNGVNIFGMLRRKLPGIDPGEGYELVPVGYVLDGTEECWEGGAWIPRSFGRGIAVRPTDAPTRRKLPPERYPTTPLPEGFDRWECRGFGWNPGVEVWYCCWDEPGDSWFSTAYFTYPAGGLSYEYWEAVKDQPQYRFLQPGELIEEGDEWFDDTDDTWNPRRSTVGKLLTDLNATTRRPITNTPPR